MSLCVDHEISLIHELKRRGLHESLTVSPFADAAARIDKHAINFSGKAAFDMAGMGVRASGDGILGCPVCFVNAAVKRDGHNPGLTVDDWCGLAAEETLNDSRTMERSDA